MPANHSYNYLTSYVKSYLTTYMTSCVTIYLLIPISRDEQSRKTLYGHRELH